MSVINNKTMSTRNTFLWLYPNSQWICLGIQLFSVVFGCLVVSYSLYSKSCSKSLNLPANTLKHGIASIISFIIHSLIICVFIWDWTENKIHYSSVLELCLFLYIIGQSFKYIFLIKRIEFLFYETDYNQLYKISNYISILIFCGIIFLITISFTILICNIIISSKYIKYLIIIILTIILLIINILICLIFIYQFNLKLFNIMCDNQEFDPNDPVLFASYNLNVNNNNNNICDDDDDDNDKTPLLLNNEYTELTEKMIKITLLSMISIITTMISINGMLLLLLFINLSNDSYINLCFIIFTIFGFDCIINILCIYFNLNISSSSSCCYKFIFGLFHYLCLRCCLFCAKTKFTKTNNAIIIKRPQRISTSVMELQGSTTHDGQLTNVLEDESTDNDSTRYRTGTV